jgi:hypothetical protein
MSRGKASEPHARIETLGDDVDQFAVRDQVERHLRMPPSERRHDSGAAARVPRFRSCSGAAIALSTDGD